MKEYFDQLRAEAEEQKLPQPAELRARGDRRAARRGAAGAFSLAVVMAGGFIAARPLFHEQPSITADGSIAASPWTTAPESKAVPNVVGMSSRDATNVLTQQGFKVEVKAASPPSSGAPEAGKVRQQDPAGALRIPSQTTVVLYVDQPQESTPACADKYPKLLSTTLFVKAEVDICYSPGELQTPSESLPNPCPATVYPSESRVEDRRGFIGEFTEEISSGPAPTMAHQTITKYKGTGAKDYMNELGRDVGRCEPVKRGGLRLTYSFASGNQDKTIGEQSLLINAEYRFLEKPESGPQTSNYLISVVLVGVYVVVVYDKGWEGTPSKPATILDTAKAIATRLISSPSPAR